jgi:hypothetical protein
MRHSIIVSDISVYVNNKKVTTTVRVYGAKDDNDQWFIDDVEYHIATECDNGNDLTSDEQQEVIYNLEHEIYNSDWEFDRHSDDEEYLEYPHEAV